MKTSLRSPAFVLAVSALCFGAYAQSDKTREQVQNELTQAIRSGDIISGESGLTLREQFPERYGRATQRAGLSRAQVEAELADAMRGGDLIAGGELGLRPNQGVPGAFPRELMVGQKTRAQAKAELAEAIRTGNMLAAGESGQLLNQQNPVRYSKISTPNLTASDQGDTMSGKSMR